MGGHPWMLTFSGMAEVLGWPTRPPLVPDKHRSAVLEAWAPCCKGLVPKEHSLPFDKVRAYTPEQFVKLLAQMQVGLVYSSSSCLRIQGIRKDSAYLAIAETWFKQQQAPLAHCKPYVLET